jgi:hypothetical protein
MSPQQVNPEDDDAYELLPEHIREQLPALYETEGQPDPLVIVKYFTPWTSWTWYATEGSRDEGDDEFKFFGLVDGHEKELGYFLLSELESVRGPGGLKIERDLYFKQEPVSKFK